MWSTKLSAYGTAKNTAIPGALDDIKKDEMRKITTYLITQGAVDHLTNNKMSIRNN